MSTYAERNGHARTRTLKGHPQREERRRRAAERQALAAAAETPGPVTVTGKSGGTTPAVVSAPPRAPDAKAVPVQRRAGDGSPGAWRST